MTEAYAITMPPTPAAGILAGPAAAAPSLAVGGQPHVQVPFSQPVLATQQRSPHALLMQQQQAEAAAAAMASGVNGGLAAPSAQAKSDTEDTDVEDEENGRNPSAYKCKPRRKATQKPVGSDQKRQAFSKRKRGIVLKAYQLYKLTDAKVFMFMVNDKGSSWAYASPSFGSSLRPDHLKHMRELADLPHTPKHITEVMAHPKLDESDRVADNRHMYLTSLSVQDNLHLVTGSVPASVPFLQPPPMAPIHGAPRASYGCPTQLPDGMLLHVGHPQMQPQHATLQQPHHLPAEHYMHHAQHPQAQHLYGQPQQAPQYMHMHLPHHQPQQHLFQPQPQPQLAQYGCPVPVPAPVPAPAPAPVPAPAPAPGGPPNAAGSAAAPNASGAEGAGSEHSQQPSSSFGQKAVQADKPASPSKGTDGADPKPQAQVGKTGSDEVAIITAGSANLGTFKPEDEAEATQAKRASGSGQAGKRLSSQQKSAEQQQPQQQPQQQQQQPYQQQPQQQAHQTQQQQQQSQQQPQHAQQLTSLYAGRVIADPSGNLYRVVNNDQLLPLLPHEVDQALAAAGLQSPGLATLAAAAAAAGGPGGTPTPAGAPPPSTLGMGAVPATAALGPGGQPPVHAHHLNTGGSLYGGAPEGPFGPPQPQYAQLLLPQQLGVGYSQPMFMDGAGGSQAMGGVGIYMSQPMGSSYPMHTQSQPLGLPPYPGNAIFYGGPPLLSSTPLQQGVPAP